MSIKAALAAGLGFIAGAIVAFILLLMAAPHAHARWKAEYAEASPSVRGWYENAIVTPEAHKRFDFWGCCKYSDVVKTKFRVAKSDGGDQWWWLDKGTWREVPADIIHWGESAPDGQPTLFVLAETWGGWPPGTPTCFYPPPGGL